MLGLSEDLGPHDVFFSWVRWDGGVGISRMVVVVVVVGSQKYSKTVKYWFNKALVLGFEESGVRTLKEYVYGSPDTLPGAPWGPRSSKIEVLWVPRGSWALFEACPISPS